jgi:hypothetical protein
VSLIPVCLYVFACTPFLFNLCACVAYLSNSIHGQTQTSINAVMKEKVYDPIMFKLTNEFPIIKVRVV